MVFRFPTVGLVRMMYFFPGLKSELKKSCENAPEKQAIEISSRISFFMLSYLIEANISQSHFQKAVLTEF